MYIPKELTIRDLGSSRTDLKKINQVVKNKYIETNKLTKDKKFIIPLKEYKIFNWLYFSCSFNNCFKHWHISLKPHKTKYPFTKTDF